ncbi:MAG: hypothetical protein ACR2G6_10510 [Gemmatimonadaceae bacterium]
MLKTLTGIAVSGLFAIAASVSAQGTQHVPDSYRPPPGMCRIWLTDVPPARQPEPTDCPAAIRRRPPNARVIFGEQASRDFRPAEREKTRERTKPSTPEKKRKTSRDKNHPDSVKPIRPEGLPLSRNSEEPNGRNHTARLM